ncbi:MAG TPA: methyltransferase domain-containing protein [Anaerolineales bacterium]|nr:methyltransferase domain-containing protein [Anaerolineales bacterium]
MISPSLKKLFFSITNPVMYANAWFYRSFLSPNSGSVKVHLGPGQKNYLHGWINVDANIVSAKIDVWANFSYMLPFRDNSVDVFYSHHVIEHVPNLQFHFKEMYRCLKPSGVFRVGGPNGDSAIKKYVEKDVNWFSDFPQKQDSLGGRLNNLIFCAGEHLSLLTFSYLEEICQKAGFDKPIYLCQPTSQTNFPQWISPDVLAKEWESTPDCPYTLIIEGQK